MSITDSNGLAYFERCKNCGKEITKARKTVWEGFCCLQCKIEWFKGL